MTDELESHRRHLFAIAYRMLGSAVEAEDVVQDAFLRFGADDRQSVQSIRAFLTTVVTRLCLDRLKSARVTRETYAGPWLPEPVRTTEAVDRETISMAFLVVLESLSATERAVYLLHQVFDHDHAEIAAILGKEEAACRQIFHRAKERVLARRPRFAADPDEHRRLVVGFIIACASGDLDGLRRLLADDAAAWSDGGGRVPAARLPVMGRDRVARLFLGLARKGVSASGELADVNGNLAVIVHSAEGVSAVWTFEAGGGAIRAIRIVRNPDKLALVDRVHLTQEGSPLLGDSAK